MLVNIGAGIVRACERYIDTLFHLATHFFPCCCRLLLPYRVDLFQREIDPELERDTSRAVIVERDAISDVTP